MARTTEFALWLRRTLRQKGLNQKQLAANLGVDASTVSKWAGDPLMIKAEIRAKLAAELDVPQREIPFKITTFEPVAQGSAETPEASVLEVTGVDDGVPDHCLLQVAHERGLFRANGVRFQEYSNPYPLPATYPARQKELISRIARSHGATLVAGQKDAFPEVSGDSKLTAVGQTNWYFGYSLITTANKELPSVYAERGRPQLRRFLELFDAAFAGGVLKKTSSDGSKCRVAYLGPMEWSFVDLSIEFYQQLKAASFHGASERNARTVAAAEPTPTVEVNTQQYEGELWSTAARKSEILSVLETFVTRAQDIAVGDAMAIATALANPKRFKILLTYPDCLAVLNELSPAERDIANGLALRDGKDPEVAVRDFKEHWSRKFRDLEHPVQWFLTYPPTGLHQEVFGKIQQVIRDVVGFVINDPTSAMEHLYDIVRSYRSVRGGSDDDGLTKVGLSEFRQAWEISYKLDPNPTDLTTERLLRDAA